MNRYTWQYYFLVLICVQIVSFQVNGQNEYQIKIDSLQREIESKSGVDAAAIQLELVLVQVNVDQQAALELAFNVLETGKKNADRKLLVQAYYVLGRVFVEMKNYRQSQHYLDTALLFVSSSNDNWMKGEILYRMGTNSHYFGNEIESLEFFNRAVQYGRLSDNFKTLGSTYSMMGTIYRMNGLYNRAIEYIIKAELNYEKANFMEGNAWADYLLGRTYADLGLLKEAMQYFSKSLDIYTRMSEKNGDEEGRAICYTQIALLNIQHGDYEVAREKIEETRKIYAKSGSKYGMAMVFKDLGTLEYYIGNYKKAEQDLKTALEMKKEFSEKLSNPGIYKYLGLSLIKQGKFNKGIRSLESGLEIAVSNDQKKVQRDIYEKLAQVYQNAGKLEKAIEYQNKQIQIQDLILVGGGNVKASQLSALYELDQKNHEIEELEKQNKINKLNMQKQALVRNFMIIGIALALLVLGLVYWVNRKLKRANLELNEINAAKDKFFAIISHDLRGPTGSLTSFLQHLESNFDHFSEEELKETVAVLSKSAENVNELLENLLIWAKSQANRIGYRPGDLNLSSSVERVLKNLEQQAASKKIAVRFNQKEDIEVFADPNMLQAILRNILSNAIKFTHRGGRINIDLKRISDDKALVQISDTGVGIQKSKLEQLFDISDSYHTKGTENEMSTGLGLIMVKDFVEKNGGSVSVESEPNKGTVVSFTLPLKAS